VSREKIQRVAIQGERGSNSHMAALAMLEEVDVVPCEVSSDVMRAVVDGSVDGAVLPIENSLHGAVAEHYDLLLANPVRLDRESLLRIRHNLIAAPGVELADVKFVLSHPVALSQCRKYLGVMSNVKSLPFYDTAGSVKHVMADGLRDTAAVAPALAATEYGAHVLVEGIEDHAENFTRFHLVRRTDSPQAGVGTANKMTVGFAVEHRPGTLVGALQALGEAGVDLTQIESRPVHGKPWEYVFFVDFRFSSSVQAERALEGLRELCGMVKELGRFAEA
jgi:prephenate dehydratase